MEEVILHGTVPPWKERKFAQWLTVKESTICADAGYGLYTALFFRTDDTITIYVGKKANNQNTDDSRRLDISRNLIDFQPSYFGARPLYFGAHFANSPYYHIPNNQHDAYDINDNAGRNANARIVGVLIQCQQDIQRGEEIRLDYGHRTTTPETSTKIKKPMKKQTHSLGTKRTRSGNN